MQGGLWNTTLRGLHVLGLADTQRPDADFRSMVLNAIHPLVPEELIEFLRTKQRVFVVEEGMPNYHRARAEGARPRGATRRRDPG